MTSIVLAISAAYVVLAVLLLMTMSIGWRLAWWIKAGAIVAASVFFIEAFFATKALLSFPSAGTLPQRFQLLWVRVVEPDMRTSEPGAIYLWIEEVDENNVPSGLPRSFRVPYTRPLADRSVRAREEIMRGRPQQGLAENLTGEDKPAEESQSTTRAGVQKDSFATVLDLDQYKLLQQAQRVEFSPMPGPLLPPKY